MSEPCLEGPEALRVVRLELACLQPRRHEVVQQRLLQPRSCTSPLTVCSHGTQGAYRRVCPCTRRILPPTITLALV